MNTSGSEYNSKSFDKPYLTDLSTNSLTNSSIDSLTEQKIKNLFISAILLICCSALDTNNNYKMYLGVDKIIECLKSNGVDGQVIEYAKENCINGLEGRVNYLRNNADSECMCLKTEETLYLVFCGTQFTLKDPISLIKDLYTDLSLGLKPLNFLKSTKSKSSIQIHSKYQENMQEQNLIKKIYKIVNSVETHKKIVICGHSMGCGLALYTALYLSNKNKYRKFDLFTLDAPKLGNDGLNRYLGKNKNINHVDMINGNDVIPLYPFIYPNYTHIFKQIVLVRACGQVKLTKKFSTNILDSHSINDHYCCTILKYLHEVLIK